MTIDIRKNTVIAVIVAALITGLFVSYVFPWVHPTQLKCHDMVYVMAPFEDDEDSAGGLPPRRTRFACPHPEQKLEVIGHGGLTCKCTDRFGSTR